MSNLLKATEVKERLNVALQTVYRLTWAGELKRVRVGGGWRWPEDEIHKYLERHNEPKQTSS